MMLMRQYDPSSTINYDTIHPKPCPFTHHATMLTISINIMVWQETQLDPGRHQLCAVGHPHVHPEFLSMQWSMLASLVPPWQATLSNLQIPSPSGIATVSFLATSPWRCPAFFGVSPCQAMPTVQKIMPTTNSHLHQIRASSQHLNHLLVGSSGHLQCHTLSQHYEWAPTRTAPTIWYQT